MVASNISKAWKKLELSKKRHLAGVAWLSWGTDEPDKQGEPSTDSLERNSPIVRVLIEELGTLESPNIHTIMAQATCLNLCP